VDLAGDVPLVGHVDEEGDARDRTRGAAEARCERRRVADEQVDGAGGRGGAGGGEVGARGRRGGAVAGRAGACVAHHVEVRIVGTDGGGARQRTGVGAARRIG